MYTLAQTDFLGDLVRSEMITVDAPIISDSLPKEEGLDISFYDTGITITAYEPGGEPHTVALLPLDDSCYDYLHGKLDNPHLYRDLESYFNEHGFWTVGFGSGSPTCEPAHPTCPPLGQEDEEEDE